MGAIRGGRSRSWTVWSVGLAVAAALLIGVRPARADVTHVVQRGHTLEAIAHRYHVSQQAILDANHLKDGQHLKPGQLLIIPGVDPASERGGGTRGVVHAVRHGETFRIRVRDAHGHVPASALSAFERLMRQGESNERRHPPDPRLVAMIGTVSDHFSGKTLEIVSGYRVHTPTQYTAHSNHNEGKALDFRVHGVPNETLRDFCLTLHNVGCGYYPNSTFVHLDVRNTNAYWVDLSHPGEAPQYESSAQIAAGTTPQVVSGASVQLGASTSAQPSSVNSQMEKESSSKTERTPGGAADHATSTRPETN